MAGIAQQLKYTKCGYLRWINRYDDGIHDEGYDIAVNSTNEVLIGGESFSNFSFYNFQYLVIKYGNFAGNQIWVVRDGPFYEDVARKIAVDNNNNIFIAGVTNENDLSHYFYDFVLIKFDPNGNTQWVRYYGLSNKDDYVEDLTIGLDGYIYITGGSEGTSSDFDWATIKYDQNGNALWTSIYNGSANGPDGSQSIAVDASGNVYVTGVSWEYENPPEEGGDGTGQNTFTTIKYNTNGLQQWVKKYYGTWSIRAAVGKSVTLVNNEPCVTGYSRINNAFDDYVTIKYNSNGIQQWLATYDYAYARDEAKVIKSDANYNIYVTGRSQTVPDNNNSYDYLTIKYNSSGVEQWNMRYNNSTANGSDEPSDLLIKDDGIYVTGKSDNDPNPYYVNYDYLTVKYGNGWNICDDEDNPGDNLSPATNSIARINDSTAISVGEEGQIKVTTNCGVNWNSVNSNTSSNLSKINIIGTSGVISGSNGTVLLTSNSGASWVNKSLPTNRDIKSVQILNNNTIFCCGENGSVYKSTNSANNWLNISIDTTYYLNSLFFRNSNNGFMVGKNGLLLKTTDSGSNWSTIPTNITTDLSKIIFINQQFGFIIGNSGTLLVTSNAGNNWIRRNIQFNSNFTDFYFLNNLTGYITGSNGLILSTFNGGNSWQRVNTYCSADLTAITFIDSGRGIISSNDGRIFLSNSGEFYYNSAGDNLQTDNTANNEIIRDEYQLFQNYPNPFNPETEIKFKLQENSKTVLRVYDVTGRLVIELLNEYKPKGVHKVKLNASNLASGIYFYNLIVYERYGLSVKYSESKKMILVK